MGVDMPTNNFELNCSPGSLAFFRDLLNDLPKENSAEKEKIQIDQKNLKITFTNADTLLNFLEAVPLLHIRWIRQSPISINSTTLDEGVEKFRDLQEKLQDKNREADVTFGTINSPTGSKKIADLILEDDKSKSSKKSKPN